MFNLKTSFQLFLWLFIFVSCASEGSKERKPFMIVGKVVEPTYIYTIFSGGFDMGSVDNRADSIGTKFHSFDSYNFYPNLFTIWHLPFISLAVGDKYTYSYMDHTRYDKNSKPLETEQFRAETHSPYVMLSKLITCPKKMGCFVLTGSYMPYVKTKYTNFGSANRILEQSYKGKGYEGQLMIFVGPIAVFTRYQKLIFQRGYTNESIFFGGNFYFKLF